ncbi:MAG TPA: PHB depolymerase family esterase [Pseudoxanthomonas sp.]
MAQAVDTDGAVFDLRSPLAGSDELAKRTQTPTTYDRLRRYVAESKVDLAAQTVDLARERFDLYVPRQRPTNGYGLLVWIAPQEEGRQVPREWRGELDRRGIIYVAARKGGNSQNVLDRRIPLALHAAYNVMQRHHVDPERVYIGGFSGGSRSALRTVVAYPDLFRGALLNAGSDVLGETSTLPAADLVSQLQSRTRLVYVTGARDLPNRRMDARSLASAEALCVANLYSVPMGRGVEHAPPDGRAFAKAMAALESPPRLPPQHETCLRELAQRMTLELDNVQSLVEAGDWRQAGMRLAQVDQHWGGLASPRSLALARRIETALNENKD